MMSLRNTSDIHICGTRHTLKNSVIPSQLLLENYVKVSVFFHAASTWNNMQNILPFDMV